MSEWLRLGSFLAFLALGARVRLAPPGGDARRRAVQALLWYVVALSLLVGVTQQDDWPFSSYTIAVGRPRLDAPICTTEFLGVDGSGREWRIDPYSWSPVYDSVLQYWFEQRYPPLGPEERKRALRFMFERAEAARARLALDARIGFERRLGTMAAPYWLLLPRPPSAPTAYRAFRVQRACWTAAALLADPGSRTRSLVAEYRP